MLAWARKMARADVEAVARRVGVSAERLTEWESGARVPTLSQLRELAAAYKRSMGVFFLKEIPRTGEPRPVDFRRLELSSDNVMSPELAAGLREAEAKRDAALDIYREIEEEPPQFDLQIAADATPEQAAEVIAERLGISMASRRSWGDEYQALAGWRSAIEAMGVMVIQLSRISIDEMRGAALWFNPLPVILLNSSDSPLARLFSMLHELTHLARHESALCDETEGVPRSRARDTVEVYCNHVAGALLVPRVSLLNQPAIAGSGTREWGDDVLRSLRRTFWASREVVLRRLLIVGRTTPEFYARMRQQFEAEYARLRERPAEGFVPPPRKVVLGNGRLLTKLAMDAYASSAITGSELARVLGTKLDLLPKIAAILRERAPA